MMPEEGEHIRLVERPWPGRFAGSEWREGVLNLNVKV